MYKRQQEEGLGCFAQHVAGKVHVLGRTLDYGAGSQVKADERSVASLRKALGDTRGTQVAAAVIRHHEIAGHDRLDAALRTVAHRHLGSGGKALIIVPDHEGKSRLADQEREPLVLDGVGVLKFVDEHVARCV